MISENPNWFDLSKYNALYRSPNFNWFMQLKNRSYQLDDLSDWQYSKLFRIRAIENLTCGPYNLQPEKKSDWIIPSRGPGIVSEITPLTFSSIGDEIDLSDIEPSTSMTDLMGASTGYLEIDMKAKKRDILAGFRSWLDSRYAESHAKPHRTGSTLEKCSDYQVIAYIDLISWSKLTSSGLSKQRISELLFPNIPARQSGQFIHEQVNTLARMVTDKEFLTSVRQFMQKVE